MATFTVTIEVKVAQYWIEDGFDPKSPGTKAQIADAIEGIMPYAGRMEFSATVKRVSKNKPKHEIIYC